MRTGRGKGDMNTTFLYGVFRTNRGSYASFIHPCIHAGCFDSLYSDSYKFIKGSGYRMNTSHFTSRGNSLNEYSFQRYPISRNFAAS